jgi:hypothetical protein
MWSTYGLERAGSGRTSLQALSLRKLGFDFCKKRLIEAHEYRALQLARRVGCPQVPPGRLVLRNHAIVLN